MWVTCRVRDQSDHLLSLSQRREMVHVDPPLGMGTLRRFSLAISLRAALCSRSNPRRQSCPSHLPQGTCGLGTGSAEAGLYHPPVKPC